MRSFSPEAQRGQGCSRRSHSKSEAQADKKLQNSAVGAPCMRGGGAEGEPAEGGQGQVCRRLPSSLACSLLPPLVCLENDSQECSRILMDGRQGPGSIREPLQGGWQDWAVGPERLVTREPCVQLGRQALGKHARLGLLCQCVPSAGLPPAFPSLCTDALQVIHRW